MDHLRTAYKLGVAHAQALFEKRAAETKDEEFEYLPGEEGSDAGDVATALTGAIPLIGSPLSGVVSGQTTPISPGGVGAMTSAGSAAGQALGGLGGAALGAGLGGLGGWLAQKYKPEWQVNPQQGALLGGLVGGGAGLLGGGAYGAHRAREETEQAAAEAQREEIAEQIVARLQQAQRNRDVLQAISQAHAMGGQGMPLGGRGGY